jgi:hypothetical protein
MTATIMLTFRHRATVNMLRMSSPIGSRVNTAARSAAT